MQAGKEILAMEVKMDSYCLTLGIYFLLKSLLKFVEIFKINYFLFLIKFSHYLLNLKHLK
jgi:hypothetical protein